MTSRHRSATALSVVILLLCAAACRRDPAPPAPAA
ncbi:MAG: hypothetical protein JWL71_2454, partial [Acidobacteria bacterium]|nr:hypothetical protein [Acidobacteriota bacterium]